MGALLDACWRSFYRCAFVGFAAYTFVFRPRVRSAHVLVWWRDRLLMARHSYKRGLSAPAGMIHKAEDPAVGAARELREEVGIHIPPVALQLVHEFETARERARDRAFVFAIHLDERPAIQVDNREIIGAEFLTLDEIRATRLRPIFEEILERIAPLG